MLPPSINRKPVFLVDDDRSDPARSTKTNFPKTTFGSRLSVLSLLSTFICRIP